MRRLTLLLILMVLVMAGCARGLGPRSLPVDRTAYVEALGDSWKDQVLYNLVKLRYGDAPTYLDVSNIVQAYQLQTGISAGYTGGWSPRSTSTVTAVGADEGTKTTVTLPTLTHGVSAGVSGQYQTSPTITYQPISGDALKESLLKPIPIDELCKALETLWDPDFILPYIVLSINNLQNKPDNQKFLDLITIWRKLLQAGVLRIVFEEVKEVKAPEMNQNEEPKGKADKWGESAENLAKFTSKLVKEQEKQSEEKTKAPFIILNRALARDKKMEEDLKKFKEYLGLVSDPEVLKKKARGLLNAKPFDKNVKDWLKDNIGLNDQQITKNEKAIGEFLGLIPSGLTSQEQENLKSLWKGSPNLVERYQVVSGVPPDTKGLSKIYLSTRSITNILVLLSKFVEVPPSNNDKVYGRDDYSPIIKMEDDRLINWFAHMPLHLKVRVMGGGIGPDLLTKPNEFAAVKYKGYWFYVRDDDRKSKDILSGMIGIFTMMPAGKKEAPVLTLPVR